MEQKICQSCGMPMTVFEKFLNSPDTVKEEDLLTEVYIPVTRLK